ncbi:hydroxy-delta-5-steroid dehydrogenase, 3 beta- and steroid delta-isomerase 1 [Periophthalmus magnuspinnatus]|uniref:hydroxy-delta-5-steroid dehydrogenase, 3 beta- and steroid delta-isomerase 1 n=1 Tax=Periophthalmus magnuspinnatus TaxID=409849 RepID=UPI00145A0D69|nr:hydroxy-delta-5-steroid dehydrogenase, 3 beta- and steroid delta-isomerase 1 [Periophthalmus magnuspinnatus]
MALNGDMCVVTGACGFLGRRLIRLLLEEESLSEIRLVDKQIKLEDVQSFKDCRGDTRVRAYEGDIRDSAFLRRACRGASTVFHVASIIDVDGSVEFSELHGVNVKGTQLLLEACIEENVSSFIYTSTIEVLGPNPSGEPIYNGTEETQYKCSLKFPYSKTKKEAEERSLKANGELLPDGTRLATCALRPMYIYGEGCRFLLGHMADGVRNRNVLYRMSLKEAKVNPVYVGNAAMAHLQAARALKDPNKRNVVGGRFYFISDNTPPVSYSDFNHVMMSPLGFSIQDKLPMPLGLLYVLCFLLEVVCTILRPFVRLVPPLNRHLLTMLNTPFTFSYKRAQAELGYAPQYSWQEARKSTIEWLAGQLPAVREKLET